MVVAVVTDVAQNRVVLVLPRQPREPVGLVVPTVQRRRRSVEPVEVLDQRHEPGAAVLVGEMPGHGLTVIPLRGLTELAAHEE